MTSTLTKWYEEHGRHEIFAGGKKVGMDSPQHTLILNKEHVDAAANDTFEKSGIAKNAREEKLRAREAKLKQDAENARMAKLYREQILGEKPVEGGLVQHRLHRAGSEAFQGPRARHGGLAVQAAQEIPPHQSALLADVQKDQRPLGNEWPLLSGLMAANESPPAGARAA